MSDNGQIGWAVLEKFGMVRLAGYVTEEQRFGEMMGRIDIPRADGTMSTQYFGAKSVYALTPVSEEVARAVAARSQPEPVHRWELPPARARARDPEEEESQAAEYAVDDEGGESGVPF